MTPNERPLGVFDSGLGGLTVVRRLRAALPREDIVYLGDTARLPYGTKSPAAVIRFACEDTAFLTRHRVKAVVVACNTASAWALPALRERFNIPIFGVIAPGARAALRRSTTGRIGVIGTRATIRSETYEKEIHGALPSAKVFSVACPLLVPLVEEGWANHAVTRRVLVEYLRPLLRRQIDTLVLGCTHYPLLKTSLRQLLDRKIALVDSAECCAETVRDELRRMGLCRGSRRGRGFIQPFVTDEAARFEAGARRFLRIAISPARQVELSP